MATKSNQTASNAGQALADDVYLAFHYFPWDRTADFLTGVIYACGGPKNLDRTGLQADIVMHSRIFYYKHKTGIDIPFEGYRDWLRKSRLHVEPVEFSLLETLCRKRDLHALEQDGKLPPERGGGKEGRAWMNELYRPHARAPKKVSDKSQIKKPEKDIYEIMQEVRNNGSSGNGDFLKFSNKMASHEISDKDKSVSNKSLVPKHSQDLHETQDKGSSDNSKASQFTHKTASHDIPAKEESDGSKTLPPKSNPVTPPVTKPVTSETPVTEQLDGSKMLVPKPDPATRDAEPEEKADSKALQSPPAQLLAKTTKPSDSAPSWQTAAPKGELYVDKSPGSTEEGSKVHPGDAPYPIAFAQIIEAIQTGKPVDGIQEIPDTTARNADTRPFGTMTAPKKPWEKGHKAEDDGVGEPDYVVVDDDFPESIDDTED